MAGQDTICGMVKVNTSICGMCCCVQSIGDFPAGGTASYRIGVRFLYETAGRGALYMVYSRQILYVVHAYLDMLC